MAITKSDCRPFALELLADQLEPGAQVPRAVVRSACVIARSLAGVPVTSCVFAALLHADGGGGACLQLSGLRIL